MSQLSKTRQNKVDFASLTHRRYMLYLRHFLYKTVLEEIAESYGQWDKDNMAKVVNESYGNSERRLLYYFKYTDTDTYERDSGTQ